MKFRDPIQTAIELDRADPLAGFRSAFVIGNPDRIYLDGNSLGRLPVQTRQRLHDLIDFEWGEHQVEAWKDWIGLPNRLGAKIAKLVGGGADEVLVCDSTSVNLYKLTMAALTLRPNRNTILTSSDNFPSDVYLLQGCGKETGRKVQICEPEDVLAQITEDVAIVSLTHCAFKTGRLYDMQRVTERAHECGALVLWDLSHSVGSVPLDLNKNGVDLAVGCTYKYLNGGPGSPAFLYARHGLQEKLTNPIWGWFGQKNPFGFSLEYESAAGLQRFMTGTPPILSMAAIEGGVDLILEAGMDALREKSIRQTEFLVDLWQDHLEVLGVTLNSPTDPASRGSHVSLGHPHAYQIDQALIKEMNVIPDFRTPDNIRFGVTPLYTTFWEIAEAVLRMRRVIESRSYTAYANEFSSVT